MPTLSVVTSLYRSAPYIEEFCRRIDVQARKLGLSYEIVMINDASPDNSLSVARSLIARFPALRIIDLATNIGQQQAYFTGLSFARGSQIFLLDIDLEDQPEWLEIFRETMQREGAEIVCGVRKTHEQKQLHRLGSTVYYVVLNLFGPRSTPTYQCMARLISKKAVSEMLRHAGPTTDISIACMFTGLSMATVPVARSYKGSSSYTLAKRAKLFWNMLDSVLWRTMRQDSRFTVPAIRALYGSQ